MIESVKSINLGYDDDGFEYWISTDGNLLFCRDEHHSSKIIERKAAALFMDSESVPIKGFGGTKITHFTLRLMGGPVRLRYVEMAGGSFWDVAIEIRKSPPPEGV